MITQAKREQAFELFLTGQSLRAIASAIDVSRSTLERWSVSHDWVFQRAIIWNQRKQKALEDHIEKWRRRFKKGQVPPVYRYQGVS